MSPDIDRKQLLAIVLSSLILIVGMIASESLRLPPPRQPGGGGQEEGIQGVEIPARPGALSGPAPRGSQGETAQIIRDTDVYRVTFVGSGGALASLKLKRYLNADGTPVEMFLASEGEPLPFDVRLDDDLRSYGESACRFRESTDASRSVFEFSTDYASESGAGFTLKRTYVFYSGEYVFELRVAVARLGASLPDPGEIMVTYTFGTGPQAGPSFGRLDGKSDYRKFVTLAGGKRKEVNPRKGDVQRADERTTWAAVAGKYFTVVVLPETPDCRLLLSSRSATEGAEHNTVLVEHSTPVRNGLDDLYLVYAGPKKQDLLERYNRADGNALHASGLNLDLAISETPLIGWLVRILSWSLGVIHTFVPNYGLCIILMTIALKLLLLPLGLKSAQSMYRMQSLAPKVEEVRKRLSDQPQKLNEEIARLYKSENANPLMGCLPLVLQIPILYALYIVLGDSFDLRGAVFIPGWITDLSRPESVFDFPGSGLPVLGIQAIRVLPFVMVITQIAQSMFAQPVDKSNPQARILNYAMPVLFLFMLYDMPSGLVLYWTVQNLLSIAQQLITDRVNRRAKMIAERRQSATEQRGKGIRFRA